MSASKYDTPTPILITRSLADLNNLKLNEIISLYSSLFNPPYYANIDYFAFLTPEERLIHRYNEYYFKAYDFKIIAILDLDYFDPPNSESFYMQQVVYNTIFMPNWKVKKIMYYDFLSRSSLLSVENFGLDVDFYNWKNNPNAFWVLEDSRYIESFKQEASFLIPYGHLLESWTEPFVPLISAMNSIEILSNQILIFSIGGSSLIITLIIIFFSNGRKHEYSIYLALGERKINIILQSLIETLIVAILSITIAIFIGNHLATRFANISLKNELINPAQQLQSFIWDDNFGGFIPTLRLPSQLEFSGVGRELTTYELMNLFNVSLDLNSIITFYFVGISIVLISSIVPILFILEIRPEYLSTTKF